MQIHLNKKEIDLVWVALESEITGLRDEVNLQLEENKYTEYPQDITEYQERLEACEKLQQRILTKAHSHYKNF